MLSISYYSFPFSHISQTSVYCKSFRCLDANV